MGLRSLFGLNRDTSAATTPSASAVQVQLSKVWLDAVTHALAAAMQDDPAKYSTTRLQDLGMELQHIARGGDAALGNASLRGTPSFDKQQAQAARRPVVYVGAEGSADYGVEAASTITPENVVSIMKQAARGLQKASQVQAISALQRVINSLK
jgi:hypothetical protein